MTKGLRSAVGLQPLFDKVLVIRLKEKEQTTGGIFIPESGKIPPQYGRVIAVGSDAKNRDDLLVSFPENGKLVDNGAIVLFSRYAGKDVEFCDTNYLLLREEEIDGVVDNGDLIDRLVEQGA